MLACQDLTKKLHRTEFSRSGRGHFWKFAGARDDAHPETRKLYGSYTRTIKCTTLHPNISDASADRSQQHIVTELRTDIRQAGLQRSSALRAVLQLASVAPLPVRRPLDGPVVCAQPVAP